NATGCTLDESGIGTKWMELLSAPGVKRVAFLQTTGAMAGPSEFGAMQGSAPSLGVEVRPIRVGDAGEFERAITAFAHSSNGGLIMGAGTVGLGALRHGVIELAARHRLPAIYSDLVFATEGGLLAYAPDRVTALLMSPSPFARYYDFTNSGIGSCWLWASLSDLISL